MVRQRLNPDGKFRIESKFSGFFIMKFHLAFFEEKRLQNLLSICFSFVGWEIL